MSSSSRIVAHAAPTGFGKSHVLMGEALLSGGRSLILTSDRYLQDQYSEAFGEIATDIKGQQNYTCLALAPNGEHYAPWVSPTAKVDEGPCHFGQACSLLLGGCSYYDRVREARTRRNVLTNYDLILSMNRYTEGLGQFDFIGCDEAHELPEKISSIMAARLSERDAKTLLRTELPNSTDPVFWASWANIAKFNVSRQIDGLKESHDTPETRIKLKSLTRVNRTLNQIAQADKDWIVDPTSSGVHIEPIWPKQFAEKYLFSGAKRVAFYSATLRPKTMVLLGLDVFDFFEYPSPFPVERRPIWYVPTVRMRYGMSYEDELRWVTAVDQIIARRLDRKIVIHTVSYARQKFLLAHSKFLQYMLANTKETTAATIAQFKASQAPSILVTPSADTGVDFPGTECETIIIIKVPFPDTSSKLYKARSESDKEYGDYIAAQTLVQMAGRGMRSADDRCEVIITDSVFGYMKGERSHLFPNWFLTAVRNSGTLPIPSQKL